MKALTKRTIALLLCITALMSFSAAFAVPVMGHDPYPVKPGGNTPIPQATDTPEQPLKDVIIGIDPGHQLKADNGQEQISPNDEKTTKDRMTRGCTGVRSGVNEYDVNLAVSVKLMALLQDAGATVVMTRTKNDVSVSNKERAEMMNDAKVDFWIRIHCNSSTSKLTEGALVIAPSKQMAIGAQSDALGKALLDEFCAATGAINRSVIYSASQTGFNWSDSPVVTIEMGYLSNPQEDTKLCRASYQDACAAGIYNGIIEYMNGRDEQ